MIELIEAINHTPYMEIISVFSNISFVIGFALMLLNKSRFAIEYVKRNNKVRDILISLFLLLTGLIIPLWTLVKASLLSGWQFWLLAISASFILIVFILLVFFLLRIAYWLKDKDNKNG